MQLRPGLAKKAASLGREEVRSSSEGIMCLLGAQDWDHGTAMFVFVALESRRWESPRQESARPLRMTTGFMSILLRSKQPHFDSFLKFDSERRCGRVSLLLSAALNVAGAIAEHVLPGQHSEYLYIHRHIQSVH